MGQQSAGATAEARMTPEEGREAIKRSILFLAGEDPDHAGELNERGYNSADGIFGHSLADQVRAGRELSGRQLHAAWTMLKKYHRQICAIGIDIAEVPEPDANAVARASNGTAHPAGTISGSKTPAASKPIGTVAVAGDVAVIRFAAPGPAKDELKRVFRGWRFDGETTSWRVPLAGQGDQLLDFARRHGLAGIAALEAHLVQPSTEEKRGDKRVDEFIPIGRREIGDLEARLAGLGGELRPYQVDAVRYAVERGNCFLGDDMGLGKTIEALAAVHVLGAFPVLITCDASKKIDWAREALNWLPGRSVSIVNGGRRLVKFWNKTRYVTVATNDLSADVVVCNRDILAKWQEPLMQVGFQGHICDESQRVKNEDAAWSQATDAIANGVLYERDAKGKLVYDVVPGLRGRTKKVKRVKVQGRAIPVRYNLSGTVIKSRPLELTHQLQVLGRLNDLGGFWPFVKRFCDAHQEAIRVKGGKGNTKLVWNLSGASNLPELRRRLESTCFIGRDKRLVLKDLPAKQRTPVGLEITNRAEYDQAEEDFLSWLEESDGWAAVARAKRAEAIVRMGKLRALVARGKLEAVKAWVAEFLESGEKLIVFADHIEIQKTLAKAFRGCAVIEQGQSAEDRDAQVRRFQEEANCKLAVCSLIAGGVGITLTAASNVAFVEFGWTPADHEQAEDRCYGRVNDPHGANCWYLIGVDTCDEDSLEVLESKWKLTDVVNRGTKEELAGVHILDDLVGRLQNRRRPEHGECDNCGLPLDDSSRPNCPRCGYRLATKYGDEEER